MFEALKQACMNSLVLAFADYTKDFLLETDASKEGLGAVLSQKQEDSWFHLVAYGSWALTTHEKNYHSTKLMHMIGKLGEDKKANWPSHLAKIVHAYNATQSAVTRYSPHYLMFG